MPHPSPAAVIRLLFAAGFSLGTGLAQVSPLSWLESRTFHDPHGYRASIGRLQVLTGGEGALARRWEGHFTEASTGEERERWALLLALVARAEEDFEAAHRWLDEVGESIEAVTLRAAIKAMENDPVEAEELARKALSLDVTGEEVSGLLESIARARSHGRGVPLDPEERARLEEEILEQEDLSPEARLRIARKLAGRKAEGLATDDRGEHLERIYLAAPDTSWVEAYHLSQLRFAERRVDEAWGWLDNAEAAGGPERIISAARARIVEDADTDPDGEGVALRAHYRLSALGPPVDHLIRELERWASRADEEAAKALHRHAEDILSAPLHWKLFGGRFYNAEPESAFYKTLNEVIRGHLAANPGDLVARYGYGLLLAEEARGGGSNGTTEMLKAFVKEAAGRAGEPLPERREVVFRAFSLAFPKPDPPAPGVPEPPSIFALPQPPGDFATDYPSMRSDIHQPASYGDLVLKALGVLKGQDFEEAYEGWVQTARPPLSARLRVLVGKPSSERIAEEINRDLPGGEIGPREAAGLLNFQLFTPAQVRELGEVVLRAHPDAGPAIELVFVRALVRAERYGEAHESLERLRVLARPGHRVEEWALRSTSSLLAKESGNAHWALPTPNMNEEEKRDPLVRFVRYFKTGQRLLQLSQFGHPYLHPLALVTPEDRPAEAMLSWGMHPVDTALALYENGFAERNLGDFRQLTTEDYDAIEESLGEETPRLAAVCAFYDPVGLPPEQRLDRIEVVAIKHPGVAGLHAVVATLALRLRQHERALRAVEKIEDPRGDLAWLAAGIRLRCGRALGRQDVAEEAALALIPITYRKDECTWLITQLDELGLAERTAPLERPRPYRR